MGRALIFPGQGSKLFTDTDLARSQLNIVENELELLDALKDSNIKIDSVAGLSLGAFTAMYACGALDKTTMLFLVKERSRVMNLYHNKNCGMAAVIGLDADKILKVCNEYSNTTGNRVRLSNHNAPKHFVISGYLADIEKAKEKLEKIGGFIVPLNVTDAFHTDLMGMANREFARVLDNIEFNNIKIPYVSNVLGEYILMPNILKSLLYRHMECPVAWEKSIRTMISNGITEFIEVGPGHALSKFVKEIDPTVKTYVINNISDIEKLKD